MSSRITPPNADTDSTSRRRWTLVLAAFVLVVVLVGAIVLLVNGGGKDDSAPLPSPQPTGSVSGPLPTGQPTPTATGAKTCSLPAGSQAIPSTPIHGAEWSLVNQAAVPGATAYGPQITDPDGLRRCFAHSPVGGVFAIYNFVAAMSPRNDPDGAKTFPILRRIMTPGENLERYIDWLRTAEDSGNSEGVQLAGFKVVDVTADRLTVLVAGQAGSGFASSTWTLVWQGDDWKVVAPQPGEQAGAPYTPLQDLTGFVPWRGA